MKILVAGSTGYLGSHIVKELIDQKMEFKVLARNPEKLRNMNLSDHQIHIAQVTQKDSLAACCEGIDVVISTVGITRQKDGLTYMDVDYQANRNLLEEAIKSRVKKFIYVSVLHGNELRKLKICEAKEKFVDELNRSGLGYCIIRPSGFFSDMGEFFEMAKKGKVYLFGDGNIKSNPIHGSDLAKVCVDSIFGENKEVNVGGPEIMTQKEVAELAFQAMGKKAKIIFLPDWIRHMALRIAPIFMSPSSFGPVEFFLNVLAMDMTAPRYGKRTLKEHFYNLKNA